MTANDKRAAFEAWMRKEHPDHSLEYVNERYTYSPPQRLWEAYQAALASPEVQALKRLAKTLEEKIELYERYGPICVFEGDAMIHASHIYELSDAMEKKS